MSRKYPKIVDQSGFLAKILIVDEIGLPVDDLVSELLVKGYLVYISTRNDTINELLPQNHNLYTISPKEINSLSLIDYLVIIPHPGNASVTNLSGYPSSYKTIVFHQWPKDNNVSIKSDPMVQDVYYEDIVDQQVTNKIDQLIQLRKEGTGLDLEREGSYHPLNPRTVGKAIDYIINHPFTGHSWWLTAGEYSWPLLIERVNNCTKVKITKKVNLDIPTPQIPLNIPPLTFTADMDAFLVNRLSLPPAQIKPAYTIKTQDHNRIVNHVFTW